MSATQTLCEVGGYTNVIGNQTNRNVVHLRQKLMLSWWMYIERFNHPFILHRMNIVSIAINNYSGKGCLGHQFKTLSLLEHNHFWQILPTRLPLSWKVLFVFLKSRFNSRIRKCCFHLLFLLLGEIDKELCQALPSSSNDREDWFFFLLTSFQKTHKAEQKPFGACFPGMNGRRINFPNIPCHLNRTLPIMVAKEEEVIISNLEYFI